MCSDLALELPARSRPCSAIRLDQEDVRLLVRDGTMLDAARDDEELSFAGSTSPSRSLIVSRPLRTRKGSRRVGVRVPDELALDLPDLILFSL